MMRALFSGVSGLKAHQTKMDVIGNNISNVNTYGYKAQRVTFKDSFYQTLNSTTEATANMGGGNAAQVGYGSVISTIDVLHTRGGFVSTGQAMDVFIDGEGYLIARDGAGNETYTRVGNLNFDGAGNLVDGNSKFICGYPLARYTQDIPATAGKVTLTGDVAIDFGAAGGSFFNGFKIQTLKDTGVGAASAVANLRDKTITITMPGDTLTSADLQTALRAMTANPAGDDFSASMKDAILQITATGVDSLNADTAYTDAVAGGDEAHSAGDIIFDTIPAKASMLNVNGIAISFGDNNGSFFNGFKIKTVMNAAATGTTAEVDIGGGIITVTSPVDRVQAADLEKALQTMTVTSGSGTLNPDIDLSLIKVSTPTATSLATGVTSTAAIDGVDVTQATRLDTTHGVQRISLPGELLDTDGDGSYDTESNSVMQLMGIQVSSNGIITGEDKNGTILQLGQIVLANIPNPDALVMDGNSYLSAVNNIGEITYSAPGSDTVGSLVSSGLENSNVDLANEFADMIMTQRGFQANSRIITVGDEMLQELVNLKR